MSVSLDDFILDFTLTLAPAPSADAAFVPLMIDSGTTFTGDDHIRRYLSGDDARNDDDLSTFAENAVVDAFRQQSTPDEVWIAESIEPGAEDTLNEYELALEQLDNERFISFACIDSRVPGDQTSFANFCGERRIAAVLQVNDAEVFDDHAGDPPPTYSDIETEFAIPVFSDQDDEAEEFKTLARVLAADPDETSRTFQTQLRHTEDYTIDLEGPDVANALDNGVNVIGEFMQFPAVLHPGQAFDGRQADELLAVIWFNQRYKERLADLWATYDRLDEKIPVDETGQEAVISEGRSLFEDGVDAGHFADGQFMSETPDISSDDRADGRIPVVITLQTETGAVTFSPDIIFTRDPIFDGDEE